MCSHYWELFKALRGTPISRFSEQSSEAWNKFVQSYKSGPDVQAAKISDVWPKRMYGQFSSKIWTR